MLNPADLLKLARLYCAAEGCSLYTLGRRACGGNNRVFRRLDEGHGANTRTLAQIETFFRATWPDNARWPTDVKPGLEPRRQPRRAPCATSEGAP